VSLLLKWSQNQRDGYSEYEGTTTVYEHDSYSGKGRHLYSVWSQVDQEYDIDIMQIDRSQYI